MVGLALMLIKVVTFFLIFMVVLAWFGGWRTKNKRRK